MTGIAELLLWEQEKHYCMPCDGQVSKGLMAGQAQHAAVQTRPDVTGDVRHLLRQPTF